MISFSNINKQYGKQLVFVEASFQLNPGEKVGLVGPNGSGKTTLFRMVVGEEEPDEGSVSLPKKLTIGYFRQDVEEMRAARYWMKPLREAAAWAIFITNWKPCSTLWKTPRKQPTWTVHSHASAKCRKNTNTSAVTRSKRRPARCCTAWVS